MTKTQKTTRRLLTTLAALLTITTMATAQSVELAEARMTHRGDSVDVSFVVVGPTGKMPDVIMLTPQIAGETQTLLFPQMAIMGRKAYYRYLRSGATPAPHLVWEKDLRREDADSTTQKQLMRLRTYSETVPYEPWMERSRLVVRDQQGNACGDINDEGALCTLLEQQQQVIVYPPTTEQNVLAVEGKAYIDFIVNCTELRPDYHDNQRELGKIKQVIDSFCQNPHVRLKRLWIKGWASPEGPYDNNVRLARGRSQTLREYIATHWCIADSLIESEYEPEDWPGLIRWIEASSLPNKQGLLRLARSNREPDNKLWAMKVSYPRDYDIIAQRCLPWLRHSDYRIEFDYVDIIEHPGHTETSGDMPHTDTPPAPMAADPPYRRPLLALKTNLLFDLAAAPNAEVEVPFGPGRHWSVMAEVWCPWYVWHHNSRAYELLTVGIEARRWFGPCEPVLTGHFVGAYFAGGKYDFEWDSKGYQGEFLSTGLTYGYSWALASCLNLEASISAGVLWGPYRRYHGEFDDTHLIWKYTNRMRYLGPTKLKLSLVWLLGKKGGHS